MIACLCTLLVSSLLLATQACAAAVSLGCSTAPRSLPLRGEAPELRLRVEEGGWLEIVEAGQSVVAESAGEVMTIPQPLRYSWHWLQADKGGTVTVRYRESDNRARGSIDVFLHCEPLPLAAQKLAWLRQAAKIGKELDIPVARGRQDELLDTIGALESAAADATQRAVARQFRAEVLAVNSRSEEAAAAFSVAEKAWSALHDSRRSQAAHVGWVEELDAIGDYDAVLAHTADVPPPRGEQTYFSTRARNTRCIVLRTIGRLDAAQACFRSVLDSYRALGEASEYVVAAQTYAGLLIDRGDLEAAARVADGSLPIVGGPMAAQIRGRLHLTLADVALRRGALSDALTNFDHALLDFEQPLPGSSRWLANAQLSIAIMYEELGAFDEAYAALAQATALLHTIQAPSRTALAMLIFADLEIDMGHVESALWWRRAAEEMYSTMGARPSAEAARGMRLLEQLDSGDSSGVAAALASHVPSQPRVEYRWQLLAAAFALAQNRLPEAQQAMEVLRQKNLPLREQGRLAAFESDFWRRSGDSARSLQVLFDSAGAIDGLAVRAASPALRYAMQRQQLPLRQLAFAQLLAAPRTGGQAAQELQSIFAWLALEQDYPPRKQGATAPDAAFDQAVATELLAPEAAAKAAAESAAQRRLLSILATRDAVAVAAPPAAPSLTLAGLQQMLAPDAALVAYLDGGSHGALFWITRDAASLLDAAAPHEVSAARLALRVLLRSSSSSVADIDAAQQRLSSALFGHAPAQPPQRLYVLADESTDGIAWAALRWPGQPAPLIASTAVSIVQLDAQSTPRSTAPPAIDVIVAAQRGGSDERLPRLATAGVEAHQIVLAAHGMRVEEDTAPSRASVLAALATPGGWVHVAAHGEAQPQRIGYSGIWLEPATDDNAIPPFLSWLDVLDAGAGADLVVLNACRLGDGGNVVGANLSFAAALARAGARHVVAAQWPVSDAAATLWVPAFYSALADDPQHDPARALRTAQLRLRDSREFRHPYFWASLQTIERLSVASPALAWQ